MNESELFEMCGAAGMTGRDAFTAIDAYKAGGELTAAEVTAIKDLPAEVRVTELDYLFGSDGSRVAALVVARG